MSIIQLPCEYLWLTLDYDSRMNEYVYDWDYVRMKDSVLVEHPECLTTEDTATGAGASNYRQPKFYEFIEDLVPISEMLHEDIFIENDKMRSELSEYLNYLKYECYYINDMDYPDKNPWVDNGLISEKGYDSIENKVYNKQKWQSTALTSEMKIGKK